MADRFDEEEEAGFVIVFSNSICVEAVVRVEDISRTNAPFSDLHMHHLWATCCEKYKRDGTDDGECDKKKVVAQKLNRNERPRNEDDGCIPVIGLFSIEMFKGFPLHNVHS